MLKTLTTAVAFGALMATIAFAEVHEVKMLNKGDAGNMVFEPGFLRITPGDTVKFVAETKGHNAESIDGMIPADAPAFKGKINEEIEVTLEAEGLYGVKCNPHYAMGMVMTIAVGEGVVVPDTFFDGRVPPQAKKRFDAQLSGL